MHHHTPWVAAAAQSVNRRADESIARHLSLAVGPVREWRRRARLTTRSRALVSRRCREEARTGGRRALVLWRAAAGRGVHAGRAGRGAIRRRRRLLLRAALRGWAGWGAVVRGRRVAIAHARERADMRAKRGVMDMWARERRARSLRRSMHAWLLFHAHARRVARREALLRTRRSIRIHASLLRAWLLEATSRSAARARAAPRARRLVFRARLRAGRTCILAWLDFTGWAARLKALEGRVTEDRRRKRLLRGLRGLLLGLRCRTHELSILGSATQTWGWTLAVLLELLKKAMTGWKRVLRSGRLARRRARVRCLIQRRLLVGDALPGTRSTPGRIARSFL
ncbi:hypothetical protein T484DRAFT_1777456 [Baffinella frigidus]|nr:hypothetical protein T484DRAFT_1777456 [Cryptophyta sp. CCMP2293]